VFELKLPLDYLPQLGPNKFRGARIGALDSSGFGFLEA
jgi:hypothetical protein